MVLPKSFEINCFNPPCSRNLEGVNLVTIEDDSLGVLVARQLDSFQTHSSLLLPQLADGNYVQKSHKRNSLTGQEVSLSANKLIVRLICVTSAVLQAEAYTYIHSTFLPNN